jgi:Fe-S cluster assembly protein SufD
LNDDKHKEVLKNISTIASKRQAFTNLNPFANTVSFKVPKNVVIEKPIHVFYISQIRKKTHSTIQETY